MCRFVLSSTVAQAFVLSAHVLEGGFHARRRLLQFIAAVAARRRLQLITGLPSVVRLLFAFDTKVLLTLIALNSVLGHVLRCLLAN